jgi:hypothetical protein
MFLKGPIVRDCWCTVNDEPWVCPCANRDHGKVGVLGVLKNGVVFEEDKLHFNMNSWRGSINYLSGMEFENDVKMTLFEEFFHSM